MYEAGESEGDGWREKERDEGLRERHRDDRASRSVYNAGRALFGHFNGCRVSIAVRVAAATDDDDDDATPVSRSSGVLARQARNTRVL